MSEPRPHPEELLLLAASGRATPQQLTQLRAHARECEGCSALMHGMADFASDLAPLAGDGARDQRAIDAALYATLRARQKGQGNRRRAVVAVVALSLGAGAMALARQALQVHELAPPSPTGAEPKGPASRRVPALSPSSAAVPEEAGPAVPSATGHVPQAVPQVARAPASAALSGSPPEGDATQLFVAGNAARRAGRDAEALALYRKLQQRFPTSREARLSLAIVGRLLLDQGNAEGAAQQFEAYIAQAGPLAEDALVGRATALRRLGRVEQERETWQELLRRFPASPHAEHARARLNALR